MNKQMLANIWPLNSDPILQFMLDFKFSPLCNKQNGNTGFETLKLQAYNLVLYVQYSELRAIWIQCSNVSTEKLSLHPFSDMSVASLLFFILFIS